VNHSPAPGKPIAQSANGQKHVSPLEWVRHLGGGYSATWQIKHKTLHIKVNASLKGVLPRGYARPALNPVMLGELIDLISVSGFKSDEGPAATCSALSMNTSWPNSPAPTV